MASKWIKFCILLSLCATSVIVSEVPRAPCADFNNTTWTEYTQGTKVQVQYLLLTRKNADCASLFTQDCLNHTQQHTAYFNATLPTKVIVHGYRAIGSKPSWVQGLAQALLQREDANVLVVDWIYGGSFAYNIVVDNYKEVALQISVLINQLATYGSPLESFHFIGVSLGAHVAGFVGTLFKGKLGRITGLDPAGPMFKKADSFDRLDPSDAMFVEAIHTDSDYFGISIPVGHVDFFLNGGMDQTGCARSRFASSSIARVSSSTPRMPRFQYSLVNFPFKHNFEVPGTIEVFVQRIHQTVLNSSIQRLEIDTSASCVYGYVICDHMRAVHVYMSALNGSCMLTGFPCSSYEQFLAGQCTSCDETFNSSCPQIGLLKNSGITASPLPILEKVYLLTTSEAPFCAHHILVELKVSPLEKSAEVQVTLISINDTETELRLRLCVPPPINPPIILQKQMDETVYKKVVGHPKPLCEIDSIQLNNIGAYFYRQGNIHFEYICISEIPKMSGSSPLCVENINIRRRAPWSYDFVQVC